MPAPTATEKVTRPDPGLARGKWEAPEAVFWVALGLVMQLYCVARRLAGRMTARHDIDIANVALFWHFVLLTTAVTVLVIVGFPLVA